MRHEYNMLNARRLCDEIEARFVSLSLLLRDHETRKCTLSRMLADGQFPETEAAEVRRCLDNLEDALSDLYMNMILPLENTDGN
jgi:hypothetical protein